MKFNICLVRGKYSLNAKRFKQFPNSVCSFTRNVSPIIRNFLSNTSFSVSEVYITQHSYHPFVEIVWFCQHQILESIMRSKFCSNHIFQLQFRNRVTPRPPLQYYIRNILSNLAVLKFWTLSKTTSNMLRFGTNICCLCTSLCIRMLFLSSNTHFPRIVA